MHEKTSYKNHSEEYFGKLIIKEITTKAVAKFKQNKFDSIFQLTSVYTYISILKNIIREVYPDTNSCYKRKKKQRECLCS